MKKKRSVKINQEKRIHVECGGDASTKSTVKSIKIYTVDIELSLPRHGHCSIVNYI